MAPNLPPSDFPGAIVRNASNPAFPSPGAFYEREAEQAGIREVYDRVRAGGREMLLIAGYSGVGKSSLVLRQREVFRRHNGQFIYGKFDQYTRNTPYSAILHAFHELIEAMALTDAACRDQWKTRLLDALSPNAQIMIAMLPELESIIGEQPELIELGQLENRNRFRLYVQKFIGVFAGRDHPLVMFVDDLQWADLASLSLLHTLISSAGIDSFLLVGAYRDNEVDDTHPLALTLREMKGAGIRVNEMNLKPLSADSINRMITDAFHGDARQNEAAARIIHEKTGGNPFYAQRFLESIYQDGIIRPPAGAADGGTGGGRRQWDLDALIRRQVTENIADTLKNKIKSYTVFNQNALKTAACLGSEFSLNTIALISGTPKHNAFGDLTPFITDRLLFFVNGRYYFVHDTVREAVYVLIPEEEKRAIHVKIGSLLWRNLDERDNSDDIFLIADQLNAGGEVAVRETARQNLIEINLKAGRMAKESCAYSSALRYFEAAINLLGPEAWQNDYTVCLAAFNQAAEAAWLSADYELLEEMAAIVTKRAANILDQVPIYETLMQSSITRHKLIEAVETARKMLRQLGVRLPKRPTIRRIVLKYVAIRLSLRGKDIAELVNLPEMTDPSKLAVIRILVNTASFFYFSSPNLVAIIIFTIIQIIIAYGNPKISPTIFAAFGFIVGNFFKDVSAGYKYGQLAINLLNKNKAREQCAKVYYLFNMFIRPMREPLRNSLPQFLEGYTIGLETGDIEYASLCIQYYFSYSLFLDRNLASLYDETREYVDVLKKIRQHTDFTTINKDRQFALNLMGKAKDPFRLKGECFDEDEMLPIFLKNNDKINLIGLYFYKSVLHFLFYNYTEALAYVRSAYARADRGLGRSFLAIFILHYPLLLTAAYPTVSLGQKINFLFKIVALLGKMKRQLRHEQEKSKYNLYLLTAELARLFGNQAKALLYYEKSISASRAHGLLFEEAIAQELQAKYLLALGKESAGLAHMAEARRCYLNWGVFAKVEHLEKIYPALSAPREGDAGKNESAPL